MRIHKPYGCRRRAYGAPKSGVSDVISKYVWDILYRSDQVDGLNWPAAVGGPTLTTSTTPTTGRSTGSLTGLPAGLVDNAVSPGTDDWGSDSFNWVTTDSHYRLISAPSASVANGDRFFRYVVTGLQLCELRIVGETHWNFTAAVSGTANTASIASFPTGWKLVDWVIRDDGQAMDIYINGTDYSPADFAAAADFANGLDTISFLGANTVEGDHLVQGWRFGQTLSLADHQADATLMGL